MPYLCQIAKTPSPSGPPLTPRSFTSFLAGVTLTSQAFFTSATHENSKWFPCPKTVFWRQDLFPKRWILIGWLVASGKVSGSTAALSQAKKTKHETWVQYELFEV